MARRAIAIAGGKAPEMLDTLAAAYAETGKFDQALATAGEALALARQQNNPALVEKLKARLLLYDLETPYREPQQPPAH